MGIIYYFGRSGAYFAIVQIKMLLELATFEIDEMKSINDDGIFKMCV